MSMARWTTSQAVLAGDIFQRHVILGPRDAMRSGARLDGLKGRVTRSGQDVPVPADLETNIGEVVNIVRHVADVTAAVGGGLRAGQFIICGSLTAPMFLEPGEQRHRFRAGADRRGFGPVFLTIIALRAQSPRRPYRVETYDRHAEPPDCVESFTPASFAYSCI